MMPWKSWRPMKPNSPSMVAAAPRAKFHVSPV